MFSTTITEDVVVDVPSKESDEIPVTDSGIDSNMPAHDSCEEDLDYYSPENLEIVQNFLESVESFDFGTIDEMIDHIYEGGLLFIFIYIEKYYSIHY